MKPVKCPNCGNEIAVDESSQYLSCGSCGKCYVNPYYVKKESTSVVEQSNQSNNSEHANTSWRCVSCDATLPSDDSSPTLTCPACGKVHKNPSYKPSQPAVVQDNTTKTATNVQENTEQNNKDDTHVISWAYCPQCGNSLDLKNGRTEAYCDHCKKNFVVKRTQNGAIHLEEKKQTVNVQQNIVNIQQNIVNAPAKVGESKFTGTYGSLLGNRIVNALISLLTIGFGIPWVICRSYRWEVDHTVIDGRRLKFDGTGGQLIGSWIKWMFLTLITCGIYGLWVPLKKRAWIVEHSHIEGFAGESKFTGGLASFLGLQIVNFFILVFTLGLGVPWVVCRSMKWDSEHQVIDGRRIYFDGNAAQLFGNWIKWILLTFITCGFYGFLLPIKKQAWIVKHQSFVKPVGDYVDQTRSKNPCFIKRTLGLSAFSISLILSLGAIVFWCLLSGGLSQRDIIRSFGALGVFIASAIMLDYFNRQEENIKKYAIGLAAFSISLIFSLSFIVWWCIYHYKFFIVPMRLGFSMPMNRIEFILMVLPVLLLALGVFIASAIMLDYFNREKKAVDKHMTAGLRIKNKQKLRSLGLGSFSMSLILSLGALLVETVQGIYYFRVIGFDIGTLLWTLGVFIASAIALDYFVRKKKNLK